MNTDSQDSFAEIKELLSKSLDQGESSAVKDKDRFRVTDITTPDTRMVLKDRVVSLSWNFPDTRGMTPTCGSTD
jgi:hypothetical protein